MKVINSNPANLPYWALTVIRVRRVLLWGLIAAVLGLFVAMLLTFGLLMLHAAYPQLR